MGPFSVCHNKVIMRNPATKSCSNYSGPFPRTYEAPYKVRRIDIHTLTYIYIYIEVYIYIYRYMYICICMYTSLYIGGLIYVERDFITPDQMGVSGNRGP